MSTLGKVLVVLNALAAIAFLCVAGLDYGKRQAASILDPLLTLTRREREVLQLTAEGQSSTEIASRLFISPRTVETHRTNLMRKLGVRNQRDLVRYAVQRGVIPQQP